MRVTPGVEVVSVADTPVRSTVPSLVIVTSMEAVSPGSTTPLPSPGPPAGQIAVTVGGREAAWGTQASAANENWISTASMAPISEVARSDTDSRQVPEAILPSKADSGSSGRNVPVKGAPPAVTGAGASSSKTVSTNPSPE